MGGVNGAMRCVSTTDQWIRLRPYLHFDTPAHGIGLILYSCCVPVHDGSSLSACFLGSPHTPVSDIVLFWHRYSTETPQLFVTLDQYHWPKRRHYHAVTVILLAQKNPLVILRT